MQSPNPTLNSMQTSTLPMELIIDILTRLPVKCLLRIRCVSKQFRSIIDGPDFVNLHMKRSVETNSNLSLILSGVRAPNSWEPDSRIFSASLDSLPLHDCVEVDHPFKNHVYVRDYGTLVIGSCNGLLVVHNRQVGALLLNPSTKKHKMLPNFHADLSNSEAYYDGFGYDVATDDYKLVSIEISTRLQYSELTVYSLKTNTRRSISNLPGYCFISRVSGAFLHGSLHWIANRNLEPIADEWVIFAFDLRREEFYEVQLPDVRHKHFFVKVEVLRGCLSVVCMCGHDRPRDVWMMKEYGVKDSWTKILSFEDGAIGIGTCVKALAYSKSGDKVLVERNCGNLHWYDLEEQSWNRAEIRGAPPDFSNANICVDSLVSVDAYVGQMI